MRRTEKDLEHQDPVDATEEHDHQPSRNNEHLAAYIIEEDSRHVSEADGRSLQCGTRGVNEDNWWNTAADIWKDSPAEYCEEQEQEI